MLTLGLHRPLPLCRASRVGDDLLKANKLQLILELRLQGWVDGHPEVPISAASEERDFAAGLRRPASYFAALLSKDEILQKVRSFEHGMTDCYYRCLLQMGVERLLAVLASGSGRSDAWYREQLCLDESGGDIGDSRDEAPTALDSGDQDALAILADAAP